MPNILFEFPIDQIIERLREVVREELSQASGTAANTGNSSEPPITTKELCKFLNITEPTAIRYRKLGKIPFFEIGSAIRYSKKEVMDALRNDTKIKAKN